MNFSPQPWQDDKLRLKSRGLVSPPVPTNPHSQFDAEATCTGKQILGVKYGCRALWSATLSYFNTFVLRESLYPSFPPNGPREEDRDLQIQALVYREERLKYVFFGGLGHRETQKSLVGAMVVETLVASAPPHPFPSF